MSLPYEPRQAQVEAGSDGRPTRVGGHWVESVREEWLIEDRWWTGRPLRRHYFELVLADGSNEVVYRDASPTLSRDRGNPWRSQRA